VKPRFLTMGEVLLILQDQIRRYGGAYGVRDPELLSSALGMPTASFEGKYLHTDLYEQAAAYAFHLCQNHPFIDGNKRTALASALVFLSLNGIELDDPTEQLYKLMMNVSGKGTGKTEIAATFRRLRKGSTRRN
jgi:death on curing protein